MKKTFRLSIVLFALVAMAFVAGCKKDSCNCSNQVFVDLGLPSGTLWATCNVGAATPEALGDYFAWGETGTKDTYSWGTYKYANGSFNALTKYCNDSSYGDNGFNDNLTELQSADDAASVKLGKGWRMPTRIELQELKDNCTATWTIQDGVNGMLFTASNGNSIFLPAAGHRSEEELVGAGNEGYYCSSSLIMDLPSYACYLNFNADGCNMYGEVRKLGFSVRPVCSAQK